MLHLRRVNRLAVVIGCVLAAGTSAALAVPPKNLLQLSKRSSFTPEQEADLVAFIDLHTTALGGGDDAARPAARQKLMTDLMGRSGDRATPVFRMTYSDLLLPRLKPMIEDGPTPAGIAAMQITSMLGTDAAVTLLTRHMTPEDEKREALRMWAAAGLRPLTSQPNVSSSRLTRAISDLGHATAEEQSWPVMRQQLASLGAAVRNTRTDDDGGPEVMSAGIDAQSQALTAVITRLGNGDVAMLEVIDPHLQNITGQFLDQTDPDILRTLARATAPPLSGLFDAVLAQWDAIATDERLAQLAGRSLNKTEVLIGLFDDSLTGNSNNLQPKHHEAIERGDRTPVETAKDRWGEIGSLKRYRR